MATYQEMRQALDHIDESLESGYINEKQAYKAKAFILKGFTPAQFQGPGISQIDGDINRRRKEHEAIRIAQINAELAYEKAKKNGSWSKSEEYPLIDLTMNGHLICTRGH